MTHSMYAPSSSAYTQAKGTLSSLLQDPESPAADELVISQQPFSRQAAREDFNPPGLPPRKPAMSRPYRDSSKGLQERGVSGGSGTVWKIRRTSSSCYPSVSPYSLSKTIADIICLIFEFLLSHEIVLSKSILHLSALSISRPFCLYKALRLLTQPCLNAGGQ